MKQVALPGDHDQGTVVDMCEPCGWVFIEYFDGEPTSVARTMVRERLSPPDRSGAWRQAPACPECQCGLDLLAYLDRGPLVYRCTQCMAVLATAEQIEALARFEEIDHPEQKSGLFDLLRRLFS